MDASDIIAQASRELKGLVEAGAVITKEEHEAISELITGIASDVDVMDDYNQKYEYVIWLQKFAPKGKLKVESIIGE